MLPATKRVVEFLFGSGPCCCFLRSVNRHRAFSIKFRESISRLKGNIALLFKPLFLSLPMMPVSPRRVGRASAVAGSCVACSADAASRVGDDVSHPSHFPKRQFRNGAPGLFVQVGGGFTDDFDPPDHRILFLLVGPEIRLGCVLHIRCDQARCLQSGLNKTVAAVMRCCSRGPLGRLLGVKTSAEIDRPVATKFMKSLIASSAEGATFTSKPGAAPQGYENQKNNDLTRRQT